MPVQMQPAELGRQGAWSIASTTGEGSCTSDAQTLSSLINTSGETPRIAHDIRKSKREKDPVAPAQGVNQHSIRLPLLLTVESILRRKLSNRFSINPATAYGLFAASSNQLLCLL